MNTNILLKEIKLLAAFAMLILFTLAIGLVGIFQIHRLNRRIEDLGRHHLKVESAVMGMRIKNANYAMEVRSYVFWRVARYQGAMKMGDYIGRLTKAELGFRQQLDVYLESVRSNEQKEWGELLKGSVTDMIQEGKRIATLADKDASDQISPVVQDLLMVFEKHVYELDQFLNDPMARTNLEAIQEQISLARADKENAISFLWLSQAAALFLGTLIVFLAYRRQIQERANRQEMLNRMMDVEEVERKKLSSAVHDEMGQDLSALQIRLGLISQQILSEAGVSTHVDECRKITASLLKKSHNIAFLLRPPDLDEVGLTESLEALLLETKHMTGVTYEYNKPTDVRDLSPEYSLLIYRITQELLTNMAKYAKATRVELALIKKNSSLELLYRDDGTGFEYEEILKYPARRKEDKLRLGLIGLKERVELLDGRMQIDSQSGRGTRVVVELPI